MNEQTDYIIKTAGFYGYLKYDSYEKAIAKANEQTAPAVVYEVVTRKVYENNA